MSEIKLQPSWVLALRLLKVYPEAVCSLRTVAGPEVAEIERGTARALRNRGLIEPSLPHRNPEWYRLTQAGRAWLRRNRG